MARLRPRRPGSESDGIAAASLDGRLDLSEPQEGKGDHRCALVVHRVLVT